MVHRLCRIKVRKASWRVKSHVVKKFAAFAAGLLLIVTGIVLLELHSPTESAFEEFWLFLAADTEYAAGYSHESFRQITAGSSEALVYALVGQPLRTAIYEDGSKYLIYSNGSFYRRREVLIKDGTVSKVFSELFID